jgi:hypothetical protein
VLYWHLTDTTFLSGQTAQNETTETARKDKNAMAFVGKTDVVQANLRFTLGDQQIENTLYFEYKTGGVTPTEMASLGDDLVTWWDANIKTRVVDDLTFREVYLTDLSTQTSPTVTVTTGLPITGTNTSDPLPNHVALCVSFRTNGRGRSARGRNYVSGFGEDAASGNTFDGSIANPIAQGYAALINAATYTLDWAWVVYSRFENGDPRTEALIAPVDNVVLTDLVVDSQRRRLPGRGR